MQEDKKEGIVLSLLHIGNMYPICKNVTSFHKNFDFRKISVWTFTKNEVMLYEWSTRNFWLYAFWRSNQGCPAYRWRNGWKHVVVKIYGCRLVIVLFDGYNIMVRWVVRYVWIYGSPGKQKNRTYHFGGYGGYLKNQIEGAINIYRIWLILKDAQKPVDIWKKVGIWPLFDF